MAEPRCGHRLESRKSVANEDATAPRSSWAANTARRHQANSRTSLHDPRRTAPISTRTPTRQNHAAGARRTRANRCARLDRPSSPTSQADSRGAQPSAQTRPARIASAETGEQRVRSAALTRVNTSALVPSRRPTSLARCYSRCPPLGCLFSLSPPHSSPNFQNAISAAVQVHVHFCHQQFGHKHALQCHARTASKFPSTHHNKQHKRSKNVCAKQIVDIIDLTGLTQTLRKF